MKNKLTDLNNHLFEQLERLNDEDLTPEELEKEIERSKAMTSVSRTIIDNGKLMLDSIRHQDEYGYNNSRKGIIPDFLQLETKPDGKD